MVKVFLFSESRYPVNRKAIRKVVEETIREKGVVSAVEVSIAIVGDRKMANLNKKYRDKEGTTDVLSFALTEGVSAPQEDAILRLGDIVLSYPQVLRNAAKKELLVDQEINNLVLHGLDHLLGEHHNE